jgi:predicted nuclease of restriction endonuclease-like RecB superfamily
MLRYSLRAGSAIPLYLKPERQQWADKVLQIIDAHRGKTRAELREALRSLEGDSPDYYLVRGLAHLALADAEFKIAAPIDPVVLRREAFLMASQQGYRQHQADLVLAELASKFGLTAEVVRDALYCDLPDNHILAAIPAWNAEMLVDRYNLAQAQGLLYYANWLVINAHRNVPGEYRRLFHRIKLFGLMYAVEGNLADGYRIHVDGPASLFRQVRKYGIGMAAFLPALLQVTKWQLQAHLEIKGRQAEYHLTSESPLRSHYPKPPTYDSLLEASFVERWNSLDTPWILEREVEIVDLKGTVFVPDFALRHPDGNVVHVEIVGFWHPDYLKRKFDKVRRAGMNNLVLAVSERLNVTDEHLEGIAGPVIFFKGKLEPKAVLELADQIAMPL